jgi:hypothetical protein
MAVGGGDSLGVEFSQIRDGMTKLNRGRKMEDGLPEKWEMKKTMEKGQLERERTRSSERRWTNRRC